MSQELTTTTETETCTTSSCCRPAATVRTVRPAVDIVEHDDAVTLRVDVPGADESTIDLTIEQGRLTIQAESKPTGPEWVQHAFDKTERRYRRTFRVSDELNGHDAEATVSHGVLTLRIPKRAEAQPTKITVTNAS